MYINSDVLKHQKDACNIRDNLAFPEYQQKT